MPRINKIEAEIDTIRDNIYEETKHLTREEQIKRVNDKAQRLAVQYGFKIIDSAKKQNATKGL